MTEIEQCLNCKKPECNNCLGDIARVYAHHSAQEKDWAINAHREGMSAALIARKLGAPKETVRCWIRKARWDRE